MATLDEVVVKLRADVQQFKNAFKSAEATVTGFSGRAGKALGNFTRRMGMLRRAVFSLKGAFAVLGIGLLIKSFISAANAAEQYRLRLNAALKSTKEGGRVFRDMTKFASTVSFTFQEIMANATNLSGVVRDGADDIKKFMPVIADLAALTGLTMQETTGQFIRMMSAGAAAADLFRERGVLQMLGFKAGATVTAKDTVKQVMDEWAKGNSRFRDLSKDLATTWQGRLSMMEDAWFRFRLGVMQGGFFDLIKEALASLLDITNANMAEWVEIGRDASEKMVQVFLDAFIGIAGIADVLGPIFNSLKSGFMVVWETFKSLPVWVQLAGLASAFFFGKKGILAFAAAVTVIKTGGTAINKAIAALPGFEEVEGGGILGGLGVTTTSALRGPGRVPGVDRGPSFPKPKQRPEKSLADQARAFSNNVVEGMKRSRMAAEGAAEAMSKARAELTDLQKALGDDVPAFRQARDDIKGMIEDLRTPKEILKQTNAELDKMAALFGKGREFLDAGEFEKGMETIARARKEAIEGFEKDQQGFFTELGDFGEKVAGNLGDAFIDMTMGVKGAFKNMVRTILEELTRVILRLLVIQPIINKLKASISSSGGLMGLFTQLGGLFGGLLGKGGAAGGGGGGGGGSLHGFGSGGGIATAAHGTSNTGAGRPFIVGERGPELFVPHTSGSIKPKVGGGINVTYNIDARGADPGVEMRIRQVLRETRRSAVEESVAQINNQRIRGIRIGLNA